MINIDSKLILLKDFERAPASMSDLPIVIPSDFPGVKNWENAVSWNNPTPLISLRGGNIITGQIYRFLLPGKIKKQPEKTRWEN